VVMKSFLFVPESQEAELTLLDRGCQTKIKALELKQRHRSVPGGLGVESSPSVLTLLQQPSQHPSTEPNASSTSSSSPSSTPTPSEDDLLRQACIASNKVQAQKSNRQFVFCPGWFGGNFDPAKDVPVNYRYCSIAERYNWEEELIPGQDNTPRRAQYMRFLSSIRNDRIVKKFMEAALVYDGSRGIEMKFDNFIEALVLGEGSDAASKKRGETKKRSLDLYKDTLGDILGGTYSDFNKSDWIKAFDAAIKVTYAGETAGAVTDGAPAAGETAGGTVGASNKGKKRKRRKHNRKKKGGAAAAETAGAVTDSAPAAGETAGGTVGKSKKGKKRTAAGETSGETKVGNTSQTSSSSSASYNTRSTRSATGATDAPRVVPSAPPSISTSEKVVKLSDLSLVDDDIRSELPSLGTAINSAFGTSFSGTQLEKALASLVPNLLQFTTGVNTIKLNKLKGPAQRIVIDMTADD
jgi:hypothetical protein